MKRDHYLLLTPGPLTTSEQVRNAMLKDWCTWDEDYNKGVVQVIRQELLELSSSAYPEKYTSILIQGSGTFAVEATLGSVIKPTDKLLIASNGTYGDRMAEIAKLHQINHETISFNETEPVCPALIAQKLIDHPNITHIAFVHCETTTGIINPIETICDVAKSSGKTVIVDAMSSFGGIPIDVEVLGIDFLISSANKCIQGVPGFGYVVARRSSLEQCKGISRSLSLDLYDQWETMERGEGKWRFTSPTHVVRAFAQALEELKDEGGIIARNKRYAENQRVLVDGMRQLGFTTLLPDELQSPIITSFLYPDTAFNFNTFYRLLKDKGFVVYPGKISNADTFRVGNIGDIFPDDIKAFIQAVGDINI